MYPISTGPDYSGLVSGIGQLIQGQIANSLQGKALQGDEGALARLASVSPQRYNAIGSILQDRRQQEMQAARQAEMDRQRAEEENQRKREIAARFARGYQTANDKKGYLAAGVDQFRRFGLEDLAGMVEQDLSIYNENPGAVEQQYAGIVSSYGDQGGNVPAGIQEFEHLTKGFTPEQKLQAQLARTGVAARAQNQRPTVIGGVPYVFDPNTGSIVPAQVGGEQVTADTVATNKAQIAEAEAEARARGQSIGSGKAEAAEQAKQKSNALAQEAVTLAREIANSPELDNVSGIMGKAPTIRPSSEDLINKAKRLESMLTVDNLKLMTGVLTDRDIQFLVNISSGLGLTDKGFRGSSTATRARLEDIAKKMEGALSQAPQQEAQPAQPQQPKRFKFNPATGRLE